MKKIFVYDDEKGTGEKYVKSIEKIDDVKKKFAPPISISNEELEKDLMALRDRQIKVEDGKEWDGESVLLDEASIFIIDFNIWKAFKNRLYLTGEEVAYHVRCFSKCGLIVALNQYSDPQQNFFNLSLRESIDSFADLNISSVQLENLGLWGEKWEDFRPWYWPQLPDALESFEKKVKLVEENIDEKVCSILGLQDVIRAMSKSAMAFIGKNPADVTFQEFVNKSGNGLRRKDKNKDRHLIARIATARISKWMQNLVLPAQDVLVDAPHLVSRYPSLLNGEHEKEETWNNTAKLVDYDKLGLVNEKIEEFRYKESEWLWRPVWFWGKVSESPHIIEVKEPWERESTDLVFCEDSSRFHKDKKSIGFNADIDSAYTRRFVRKFDSVDYRPMALLMA